MRNEPWVWPEVGDAGTSGAGAVPLRSAQLMGGGGGGMEVAFATEKLLPLMGQSQGQQHTGRQYLGCPFPKRIACFHKRSSFLKSAFDNGRMFGRGCF